MNKAENTLTLKDTGSRILFRPVDDFERLRGTNLAWFGLDELTYTQEEAWLRLEGRLRDPKRRGCAGSGCGRRRAYDWVYRKFIAGRRKGMSACWRKPYENRYLLEKVPDFYERLKASYDETFYKQEVLGEYLNLKGGLVYHAFDAERVRGGAAGEPEAAAVVGAGLQRRPDVLGCGADGTKKRCGCWTRSC